MSRNELADAAGMTIKAVTRWFNSKNPRTPDPPALVKLATKGLNLHYLLTGQTADQSVRQTLVRAIRTIEPSASKDLVNEVFPDGTDPLAMIEQWAAQRVREVQAERARRMLPAVLYAVDEPANPGLQLAVLRKTVERALGLTEPNDIRQSRERKRMHSEVRARIERDEQLIAQRVRHFRERKGNGLPEIGEAQQAVEAADDEALEANDDDVPASEVDSWSFVTLGGAKRLAQEQGINYLPRIKRDALVEQLKIAGVKPPPAPARPVTEDDFTDPHIRR